MLGFGVYSQQALSEIRAPASAVYVLPIGQVVSAFAGFPEIQGDSNTDVIGNSLQEYVGTVSTTAGSNYTVTGVNIQSTVEDVTVWGPISPVVTVWTPIDTGTSR